MSVPVPPRAPRLRRFRVDVGTIITVVVLFQSLLLVAIGYWGSQRLVSTIGESAHRADHLRIEDKVNAFLAKAASVVDAVGAAPSLRPVHCQPHGRATTPKSDVGPKDLPALAVVMEEGAGSFRPCTPALPCRKPP